MELMVIMVAMCLRKVHEGRKKLQKLTDDLLLAVCVVECSGLFVASEWAQFIAPCSVRVNQAVRSWAVAATVPTSSSVSRPSVAFYVERCSENGNVEATLRRAS